MGAVQCNNGYGVVAALNLSARPVYSFESIYAREASYLNCRRICQSLLREVWRFGNSSDLRQDGEEFIGV